MANGFDNCLFLTVSRQVTTEGPAPIEGKSGRGSNKNEFPFGKNIHHYITSAEQVGSNTKRHHKWQMDLTTALVHPVSKQVTTEGLAPITVSLEGRCG